MRRLIIRPGAIGDVIVSLPAMESLRAEYTEVWTPARTVPLIRFADRVRSFHEAGLYGLDLGEPAPEYLGEFDDIVSWYGTKLPQFREAVARFPFRFLPALPSGGCHAIDFYLQQAGSAHGAVPRIPVEPQPRRDFIAVHPFSGSARKNWPAASYTQLAQRSPLPCEFCVGEEQEWPGALHEPDLYRLAQWLASARLYVGNDSGITHLAAAVGTPVIALFGPTDPQIWAPRGVNRVHVIHREPLNALAVEEVLELVRRETCG